MDEDALLNVTRSQSHWALGVSTIAFTACFAVWTIFSIIGVQISAELGLTNTQFALLAATPILTGSLSRIFLGIWTDQFGGRIVFTLVMVAAGVATWLLSKVNTYNGYLLAALGLGLSGGSFAVGIAYVSKWYKKEYQGTALGIFGMGNVGAAVTTFCAPFLLIVLGWRGVAEVYAMSLIVVAAVFWSITKDDPVTATRKKMGTARPNALEALLPLRHLRVWRFALYYFFVFGAYVALALWLPKYYVQVYRLPLTTAGILSACFAFPGSVFRALGGWLSDKLGARAVMYWTFIISVAVCFILSYPSTEYLIHGIEGDIKFSLEINLYVFVLLTILLGFMMSLGKAAVYKHIPVYYPNNVGSVGGMVGLVGGLGGFILPIIFGIVQDITNIASTCFMILFSVVGIALIWMHVIVQNLERSRHPAIAKPHDLPELDDK